MFLNFFWLENNKINEVHGTSWKTDQCFTAEMTFSWASFHSERANIYKPHIHLEMGYLQWDNSENSKVTENHCMSYIPPPLHEEKDEFCHSSFVLDS